MCEYFDISTPMHEDMPVWPEDPPFRLKKIKSFAKGDGVNVSKIKCCLHSGTHVDAPLHYVDGGKAVDELDLDSLVGAACVVNLEGVKSVTAQDLEKLDIAEDINRILIRTSNSKHLKDKKFWKEYVSLTEDAATWIVERGMRLVGVDYLSIAPYEDGEKIHKILLENDVVVVEGLNLDNIKSGIYDLTCLPIRIKGVEGAPARAILKRR